MHCFILNHYFVSLIKLYMSNYEWQVLCEWFLWACITWCSRASSVANWSTYVCMCVKSLQSCPTLCNPIDCSLPSFSIHGVHQAKLGMSLPLVPPGKLHLCLWMVIYRNIPNMNINSFWIYCWFTSPFLPVIMQVNSE